jgi:hypothetical protein
MKPPGMMARGGKAGHSDGMGLAPMLSPGSLPKAGIGTGTGTKQLVHIQKKIRGGK